MVFGELAKFDVSKLLTTLTTAFAMFSVAGILVSCIAPQLSWPGHGELTYSEAMFEHHGLTRTYSSVSDGSSKPKLRTRSASLIQSERVRTGSFITQDSDETLGYLPPSIGGQVLVKNPRLRPALYAGAALCRRAS